MSETSNNFEKINPTLKEQINETGWETGKDYNLKTREENEGGAAVFVGTKEEAEKAREIAEKEGFDIEDIEPDGSSEDEYGWALGQINKKQNKLNEEAKEKKKKGFNH